MALKGFKALIAEANASIRTISVQDAIALMDAEDVVFLDIRESAERQNGGSIRGAVHAPRGFLEFIVDPEGPMHKPQIEAEKTLVLFCASGGRSTLAARTLQEMGFGDVCHIAGGFQAWQQAGGDIEEA